MPNNWTTMYNQDELGDCEIVFQIKSKSQYAGLAFRDADLAFDIRETNDWATFRVVAAGNSMAASLDGKPLKIRREANHALAPKSNLVLCVHQATVARFKDLRVRVLTAGELAQPRGTQAKAGTWGEWKDLFNGKDMSAWKVFKGQWKAEDGMLVGYSTKTQVARVDTEAGYSDFEMTFKLRMTTGRNGEIHVHDYGQIFEFTVPELDTWHDFRVSVAGNEISCTLNGNPLKLGRQDDKTDGCFSFFVYGDGVTCSVKEIKLRELKR